MTPRPAATWTLPPDPSSVRVARRRVTRALLDAGHPEWVDSAALAVSEVVTNVVLHARTECELTVLVGPGHVRVDVRDASPALPGSLRYGPQATTGRGLVLVSELTRDWGVEVLGREGKVVWFVIGADPGRAPRSVTGRGAEAEEGQRPTAKGGLLVGVPGPLWVAGLEHWAAVLREINLVAIMAVAGAGPLAAHRDDLDLGAAGRALHELTTGTEAALRQAASDPTRSRPAPLPDGHPSTMPDVPATLDVPVGRRDHDGFVALARALRTGQQLAGDGHLLVRPALHELVSLGDWAWREVAAQAGGGEPTGWAEGVQVTDVPGVPAPAWDDEMVRTSPRVVVAADDHNRLIAVSVPAAALIGVDAAVLVGRPVTTIIPPRLRQQHVAGFTRHLATGQAHALGVELDLPVLCADGREVVRRFLIEADTDAAGRRVYVAWMDPVTHRA